MAVGSTAQYNINPAGGPNMVLGPFKVSQTAVTMENTNYAAGGVVVTPAQLGFGSSGLVYAGWCVVRTPNGTNGPGECILDCTNPAAPKIKAIAVGGLAEVGSVTLNGAVVDVVALGA